MDFNINSIWNHVGSPSFHRGRQYFTAGNVIECRVDEKDGRVLGRVAGTDETPYETEFMVEDGEIADSYCSCPVGNSCKHVAALGLKALLQLAQKPAFVKKQPEPPSPKVKPQWMKIFSELIEKKENDKESPFQLQLLFSFEQSWKHREEMLEEVFSLPKLPPEPIWDVVIRPRLYNPANGTFSVSHIKWNDAVYNSMIYWNGIQGKLPDEQHSYLQLLAAGIDRYGSGCGRVKDEKVRYFWKLLKEHGDYGVQLLGGQKGQYPVSFRNTPLVVGLQIEQTKTGIVAHQNITQEGKILERKSIAFAGEIPVFALVDIGDQYILQPVIASVPISQSARTVQIPKSDIPVLQKEFIPKLAKHMKVTTTTNTVILPDTILLQPVLDLKRLGSRKIGITAGMRYKDTIYPFARIPDFETFEGKTVLMDKANAQEAKQILDRFLPDLTKSKEVILEDIDAARFVAETIPKLQQLLPNLIVQREDDLPTFKLDTSEAQVSYSIDENEASHDWFDLQIMVKIGAEDVQFQSLFTALVEKREYVLLESGRYFSLNTPQFNRLKQLITEARSIQEKDSGGIRLSRFHAGLWEELQQTGIVAKQAQRWHDAMRRLLSIKEVVLPPLPQNFHAELRPYQAEGYAWLDFLRESKLGGILADDMGLGKTIQTIAFMARRCELKKTKVKEPFLIVAPTSVVENWDAELERFSPKLRRVIMRAGDRSGQFAAISQSDIVIVSYALLVRDFDRFKKLFFDTVIFDEAQMVKNYQSKAYGLSRKLKSNSKIALTGTPMENNLMELWSICSLVAPGLFPTPEKFTEQYRTPIEKRQNQEVLRRLKQRIRPFLLRRQKSLVATQLPAKNEQVLRLSLNDEHKHLYEKHLQYERKRVLRLLSTGGLKEHRFEILRSLTRLRQLCLHPVLVDEQNRHVSATKLEELRQKIAELISEGHRVLVFSQFTSFLRLVKQMLEKDSYPYLYLAGETKERGKLIRQFQNDTSIPIFLISLKAGGFGLNLTAADYCILLDPWWNPAVEQQAIDRTHRIGQTKPVFVYKMIAKDTIEEKVLALQEKKRKLFQNVLDKEGMFGSLVTEDDIKNIFS